MSRLRKIVVTADDFGYSQSVNDGVWDAQRNGIVNNVSVMVNGAAFSDAVERLQSRPDLGRGLHLTFTANEPIADEERVRTLLTTEGTFGKTGRQFLLGLLTGSIDLGEVEHEARRQIETGLARIDSVDHLNSHNHVHMFPPLFSLFVELADEYDVPAVRFTHERFSPSLDGLRATGLQLDANSGLLNRVALAAFARTIPDSEKIVTDSFYGVANVGGMTPARLRSVLRSNERTPVELALHPGYADEELRRRGEPLIDGREVDLRGATDENVADLVASSYEQLRFRDLTAETG